MPRSPPGAAAFLCIQSDSQRNAGSASSNCSTWKGGALQSPAFSSISARCPNGWARLSPPVPPATARRRSFSASSNRRQTLRPMRYPTCRRTPLGRRFRLSLLTMNRPRRSPENLPGCSAQRMQAPVTSLRSRRRRRLLRRPLSPIGRPPRRRRGSSPACFRNSRAADVVPSPRFGPKLHPQCRRPRRRRSTHRRNQRRRTLRLPLPRRSPA